MLLGSYEEGPRIYIQLKWLLNCVVSEGHSLKRVLFICFLYLLQCVDATTELHIGSMFPMEAGSGGWAGGQVNNLLRFL